MTYTVKTLTPLQRSQKLIKLQESEENTGFINTTNTYFDFHRAMSKPDLNVGMAHAKVLEDKLTEIKYDAKKQLLKKLETSKEN